jgi:hypothetical protein
VSVIWILPTSLCTNSLNGARGCTGGENFEAFQIGEVVEVATDGALTVDLTSAIGMPAETVTVPATKARLCNGRRTAQCGCDQPGATETWDLYIYNGGTEEVAGYRWSM